MIDGMPKGASMGSGGRPPTKASAAGKLERRILTIGIGFFVSVLAVAMAAVILAMWRFYSGWNLSTTVSSGVVGAGFLLLGSLLGKRQQDLQRSTANLELQEKIGVLGQRAYQFRHKDQGALFTLFSDTRAALHLAPFASDQTWAEFYMILSVSLGDLSELLASERTHVNRYSHSDRQLLVREMNELETSLHHVIRQRSSQSSTSDRIFHNLEVIKQRL